MKAVSGCGVELTKWTRRQFEHKQRVVRHQPVRRPHFSGKEIGGDERRPMRAEKRAPRRRPLRDRSDTVSAECFGDPGAGDVMPDVAERALDPAISPCGILLRHSDDELTDLASKARTSHLASDGRRFPRDQLSVPSKNGVGRDERRNLV
jgi:hypothetical protein